MLDDDSLKIVRTAASEAGDYLKDVLEPCEGHPVRNAYAHVWERLKHHLGGCSYKDCDNDDVPLLLELIEEIRNKK